MMEIKFKQFFEFLEKHATMEKTMNLFKYLLPIAMATCGFAAVHASDYSSTQEERETDMKALSEFVKAKSGISVQEKGGNLMISGEVRSEWSHMRAETNHKKQRGHGSGKLDPNLPVSSAEAKRHAPIPTNEFDVEVNLMFDYRADRSWAGIQLQLDNLAGIRQWGSRERPNDPETKKGYVNTKRTLFGSGTLDNLALRKAYIGYNVFEEGASRFDIEVGRRRLKDVFDSKVMFHNYFDGLLLKYANSFEGVTDFQVKLASFVIDQTVNHFGWVGELSFLNIGDEGIDFKYAYIRWDKHGFNRYGHKHALGSRFAISQFLLAYNLSPDLIPYKTQVYGAYLHNHEAHPHRYTHHRKESNAFYVGLKMGEVKRQNDWAFDVNYQWVKAQAIPESDVEGIGRDNPRGISFYKSRAQGFANYKGYKIDGLYALTDNLTLNALYQRVHQESRKIGGEHKSHKFELAAVYAF